MDDTSPKIIGDRCLPCHRQRASRLNVSDVPVTRTCSICRARYSITFVEAPHFTERLGIPVYSVEIAAYISPRASRRLERSTASAAGSQMLPFGDAWRELRG